MTALHHTIRAVAVLHTANVNAMFIDRAVMAVRDLVIMPSADVTRAQTSHWQLHSKNLQPAQHMSLIINLPPIQENCSQHSQQLRLCGRRFHMRLIKDLNPCSKEEICEQLAVLVRALASHLVSFFDSTHCSELNHVSLKPFEPIE
jgi:hypothetical protein